MTSTSTRLPARVLAVVVALAGSVAVALPTHVSWVGIRAMAPWSVTPTLVIGNTAAWGAALLGLVLALRRPRFPGTVALALTLVLGALAYGALTADPDATPLAGTLLSSLLSPLGLSSLVLATAAAVRFWSEFPRPLTAADVERFDPGSAEEPWTSRMLMKGLETVVAPFIRLLNAVSPHSNPLTRPFSAARRRRAEARAEAGERNRVEEWIHRRRLWLFVHFPAVVWPVGIALAAAVMVLHLVELREVGLWVGGIAAYGLGMVAFMASAVRYGVMDEVERRRLLWIGEGFAGGTMISAIFPLSGLVLVILGASPAIYGIAPVCVALGPLVFVLCLAIAAFWDGVFDPALALRGTAVYGLLVAGAVFVFALVEEATSAVLTSWIGLSDRVGTWVAAGAVALVLAPLQRWLDAKVRGWIPGEPADGSEEGEAPVET